MRGLFIQAHRVNRLTSTTTDPIPTASGAFEAATDTTRKTLTEQAAQVPRQTPLRGPSPVALGTASLMPRRPASASNAGAASSVAAGTGTRPTTAQPVSTRGRSNSRSGADTKVPAQRVTTAAAKTSTTGTATAKQTALMNEIASTSVVPVDLDDLIDASSPDIKAEYFNTTSTAASSITTSRAEQYAAAAGSDVTVVASTVTPPPAIFNSGMADEAAPASTAGSGLADLDGIHISMQEDTDANMDPDFGTIPSVHSRSSTLTAVVDTKIIESLKKSAAERAASGGTLGSTGSRPYLAAASSGSHQRRTSSERQADLAATLEHLRLSRDGTAASSSRLITQSPTKPTGDAATLGRQASIKSTSPSSSPSPAVMRMRSLATAPIPQTQAESSGSMEVHEKPAMPTGRDYTDQTDHTLFNLQLSDARSMVARLQEDLVHVQSQHRSEASMLRSQNAVLNDECTRLKSVVDEATSVAQQQSLEAERWLKETDRVKKSKAEMEAEHRKRLEEIDKQLVAFDLERSEELDKQREQYEAQLTQSRADYDAKLEREREKGEKLTAEREKWRNEAESTREKWTEREAELEQRQTVLDKKLVELLTTIDQLRKEKESWKQERTTIVGKIRDHQEEVKRVLEKEERKLADAAQEHAKREEEWFQEKAALVCNYGDLLILPSLSYIPTRTLALLLWRRTRRSWEKLLHQPIPFS